MDVEKIPFIVFESAQAKNERTIKKLVLAVIISIMVIFASNAIWLYAWIQYDYSSEENVMVDAENGIANYIGNNGDITNGADYSDKEETAH